MTTHENFQTLEKSTFTGSATKENVAGKRDSFKRFARITGALILIMAIIAPFGMLYIPATLVVPGDAATTANNILASNSLFRMGIVGDLLVFLLEIVLSAMVYLLLRPVNKTLALIAGFSRLAMAVIQGVNLLNSFMVLLLLSGAGYLTVFQPNQLQALVMLFLNAHQSMVLIWGLAFSLHLILLGYLIYKSGYISRIVGILVAVAGVCYLIQSFGNVLLPGNEGFFAMIGLFSVAETALPLWLLIKGVNAEKWEKRVLETA